MKDTWKYASSVSRLALAVFGLAVIGISLFLLAGGKFAVLSGFCSALVVLEVSAWGLTTALAGKGGVIVKDATPKITPEMLDRFFDSGFDSELGWIRKANISKVDLGKYPYSIDEKGSRSNSEHAFLPSLIGTYGDSYTFCREVEDRETWQWSLSENLQVNVLNFGVGNYGFDQTLLRLKREYEKHPTPITIMGMVPQGIARNLSVWKHYNEFGNILAFKPRFVIENGTLRLIPNPVDEKGKYFRVKDYLKYIQESDFFFEKRFKKKAFRPPYLISSIAQFSSLVLAFCKGVRLALGRDGKVSKILDSLIYGHLDSGGVLQHASLYSDEKAGELLDRLIDEFLEYAKRVNTIPVLLLLPMRDDFWFIRNRFHFYEPFVEKIKDRLLVIDMAPEFLEADPGENLYRIWHLTPVANKIVARVVAEKIRPLVKNILARA